MTTARVLVFLSFLLVLFACNSIPSSNGIKGQAISDGNHSGNRHFYFLPPLVPAPTYTGTFNPNLSPAVEVCELGASGCISTVANFSMTIGTGSEVIRADLVAEHYIVNWHTDLSNLDPAKLYRVRVLLGSFEVGYADIDPVSSGRELKNVDTGQFISLVNGRTLPIKFRLETGVLPPTITLAASATSLAAPGSVTLTAEATDDMGVVRVEFYEGTTLLGTDISAPFTFEVIYTNADQGLHSYSARAFDDVGAYAISNTVTVSVSLADNPVEWTRLFGTPVSDIVFGVATDSQGNTYAVGHTLGSLAGNTNPYPGRWDVFVVKYDPTGVAVWTKHLGAEGDDKGFAVTTAPDGSVYVTGDTDRPLDGSAKTTGFPDAFLARYSSNGNLIWVRQIAGDMGTNVDLTDQGLAVSTDQSGNVYVAGQTASLSFGGQSNAGHYDAFVTKYNSSGTRLWTRLVGNAVQANPRGSIETDKAFAVGADTSGNVYLAGITESGVGTFSTRGTFLAKFDSDGTNIWILQLESTGTGFDMALDPHGNVLMAGQIHGTFEGISMTGLEDTFVTKYNASGQRLWTRVFGRPSCSLSGRTVTTDRDDNVYFGGYVGCALPERDSTSTLGNVFVKRLDANGGLAWTRQFGEPLFTALITLDSAADASRGILLAGSTTSSLRGQPFAGVVDGYLARFYGW